MSLHSQILTDHAWFANRFETNINDVEGDGSSLYGTPSKSNSGGTRVTESKTGGTYSWIFDNASYYVNSYPNTYSTGNAKTTIAGEIVFKSASASTSTTPILSWSSGGNGSNSGSFILGQAGTTGYAYLTLVSGNQSYTLNTTTNISDNKWHHLAAYANTSGVMTLYLDGIQIATTSSSGVTNSFEWMRYTPIIRSTNNANGFSSLKIDLAAFYSSISGYTPTTTMLIDHAALFTDYAATATPVTASALMVNPSVSITKTVNFAQTSATASAILADVQVSNIDIVPKLGTFLSTLTLEHLYKFTDLYGSYDNHNYGAQTYYDDWNLDDWGNYEFRTTGPTFEPSIKFFNQNQLWFRDGDDKQLNIDASDFDWTIGFWIKSDFADSFNLLHAINIGETDTDIIKISYDINDDNLLFTLDGNSPITADPISANEWHFIALKYDGTDMVAYIDGINVGNQEVSAPSLGVTRIAIGSPDSGYTELADFLLTGSADLSTQNIADIYSAGNQEIQALALMPKNVLVRFNTQYNDMIETFDAIMDMRFNDESIYPPNFGTNTGAQYFPIGSNIATNIPAKNVRAFKIENTDSPYGLAFQNENDMEANQTFTVSFITKMEEAIADTDDVYLNLWPIHQVDNDDLGQLQLINNTSGVALRHLDGGLTPLNVFNSEYIPDDRYHHYVITFDNSSVKLYIDGKELVSDSITTAYNVYNYMDIRLGALEYGEEPRTVARYIDEFAIMRTVLTAEEIFDLYQSITIDGAFDASAEFVTPVGTAGYGPTINPGVSYASALLVDPTQQDTVNQLAVPLTAFAIMLHPNYGATKTVTITATALTASAEFHEPQFDIGEVNGAASMDASAFMPEAYARIPGKWNASPMIANPATAVNPAFSSTKGGLWKATPLTAKAQLVLPPAYKSLQDDIWYRELYLQHSQTNGERWKTDNIAGSAGTPSAYAFLKLFDDVTGDINGSSTSKLTNNLPWSIVNDNPAITETRVTYAVAENEFLTAANTPVLEYGYFDDSQRKAVRFNNISFKIPENEYTAQNKNYSVEFNIKTTKANQILLQGVWKSWQYYGIAKQTIGLNDGKLYGIVADGSVSQTLHPKNLSLKLVAGRVNGMKRIDDGFWHHIVIQYGLDGRTQFFIDGELDIQMYATQQNSGLNVRPYIIGYNSKDDAYQSDFYTSLYSYDAAAFISATDIVIHNAAAINYEPIKAEPMTASIGLTTGSKAAGNRGRALMLYFWPVNTELSRTADNKRYGQFDVETFDNSILTIDYVNQPPQTYFGWDLYPVDINGYYVSDLVNVDSYGEDNIVLQNLGGNITQSQLAAFPEFKANRRGWFRDPKTDDRRYIDLMKDIDLSNFEVICFRNYPDQSQELDAYARNEVVDSYFNIRESNIFEDFIKSLRAAVDTGIGLYVTNHQLAIDLGIVDRVEEILDLDDAESDQHAPGTTPEGSQFIVAQDAIWFDTFKNNRLRVRNTVAGLTDVPSSIWKDTAYYRNSDLISFGAANRPYDSFEYKPNGLAVGDEFIMSDFNPAVAKKYLATPLANIKAGKAVTTFNSKYWRGNIETDNPYANYATSIVVEPGDQLNGKPIGGKIYVNFTERLNGSNDYGRSDLIQDFWINFAYDQAAITLEQKNALLISPDNIDRRLEAEEITQEEYDKLAYWSSNGEYVLAQAVQEIGIFDTSPGKSTIAREKTKGQIKKFNKSGTITTSSQAYSTTQFFTFAYSWKYPRVTFDAASMLTRGWWWLSNREVPEGLVNRVAATTAVATMGQARVIVDKVVTINVPPMITVANMSQPQNYAAITTRIAVIPFQASAMITQWAINQNATTMLATASFRPDNRAITSSVDEVVLYVMHEDAILYVREDVTK